MDMKELDRRALNMEDMPEQLHPHEQAYFQASKYLYLMYANKKMTIEQCRKEKAKISKIYAQQSELFEWFKIIPLIKEKLLQLKSDGFNSVLEMEILELINKM